MSLLTLEALRNQCRTSLYGRRLFLDTTPDQNSVQGGVAIRGGLLAGFAGIRLPIQINSTTVPSTLYPSGYIELGATTASTNSIAAPVPGAELTITQTATSTLGHQIRLTAGNFNSSTGSSNTSVFFWGQGATMRFVGLSTAIMAALIMGQTTSQVSFSTAA